MTPNDEHPSARTAHVRRSSLPAFGICRAALGRLRLVTALALAVASTSLVAPLGCGGDQKDTATSLPSAQVREYKGEKLGSIEDFHENSIKGPQKVDVASYRLKVGGLVAKPLELTYDQVVGHPAYEKVVQLDCVEGWSVKVLWKGVLLSDLFQEAGVESGANTVIFRAVDGYSTSIPLAQVMDRKLMIAYQMNGVTLPEDRGFPFQLVAESKWGYKWIKWLSEIELSSDPTYKGYWESRGYSNDGDLDAPFF